MLFRSEKGEFTSVPDQSGKVYVADGELFVFGQDGKQTGTIHVPERPTSIVFGGKDEKILFITGKTSLYSTNLK